MKSGIVKKEPYLMETREEGITVNVEPGEDLNVFVVAGPFMQSGATATPALTKVIESVKAKNPHVLIVVSVYSYQI